MQLWLYAVRPLTEPPEYGSWPLFSPAIKQSKAYLTEMIFLAISF
jgi:hypothetical protein